MSRTSRNAPEVDETPVAAGAETYGAPHGGQDRFSNLSRGELLALAREQFESGVRIDFWGKEDVRVLARKVQPRQMQEVPELSFGDDEAQAASQIVEGENLQALATLHKLRGQVDLIVTDPPYNTGKDFRYNDRWDEDPNDPDLGELVAEDDGAKHTKWMKFMWPRLALMREMLKPGGVLAICIDHRELFRLGQMLDEIFYGNRLAIINWQKSYSPKSDSRHVSSATEYVLVYAKDEELAETELQQRTAEMDARYSSPDNDPRPWKIGGDPSAASGTAKMVYAIQSPLTGELYYPPVGRHWSNAKATMKGWLEEWGSPYKSQQLDDGHSEALVLAVPVEQAKNTAAKILATGPWPPLYFGLKGQTGPAFKRYLDAVQQGKTPLTYWAREDYEEPLEIGCTSWDHEQSGHSEAGTKELTAVIGRGHGFETVKPLKLLTQIIQLWCPPDGIVLDPFAGSGSTGHAVLAINHEAGTDRRFVLMEQGRSDTGDLFARTLTAERLRRVISGDWDNGKGLALGGGFRFITLRDKVDADALLHMERQDMVDTVIASHFEATARKGLNLIHVKDASYKYLVARNTDQEGFFLLWSGADAMPVLDEETYDEIADEAERAGLRPFYHVYACFNDYQTDNVRFYQIPNQILHDFGVSEMSGTFHNEMSDGS